MDQDFEKQVILIGDALISDARAQHRIKYTIEDKIQKIKNCFMSKGLINSIHPVEMRRLELDTDKFWNYWVRALVSKEHLISTNGSIERLKEIYNNLKQKYKEVPGILAQISDHRRFINGQGLMLVPEWRAFNEYQSEIYGKFISRRDFPDTGRSPEPLIDTLLEHLHSGNQNPNSGLVDYKEMISKVRDMIECWILILELGPGIESYGGKMKKRGKNKSCIRKTTKKRHCNKDKTRRKKTNKY